MGEEVANRRFDAADDEAFRERVLAETRLLGRLLDSGRVADAGHVAGFELEAWLVDRNGFPLPDNERYLAQLASPWVVAELARFNVELNGPPQPLRGRALAQLEADLAGTWRDCVAAAHEHEGTLAAIGILPTVREDDLCLANMSPSNRYFALNERVLAARGGRPIRLDIRGADRLALAHPDVMLEAAATSFQLHLQVPASRAVRYFNASALLSAPMVAVAANSPYLFQAALWDETRIPLFEQAVDTTALGHPDEDRVTFGERWVERSVLEVFEDNVARFPPLLPIAFDEPPDALRHLRLHNGTIWRWNRPLVGFGENGAPHVRIEHRPLPAGPSLPDMIANAAMYYGAVRMLAEQPVAPESLLPFGTVREDFYRAARDGLAARVRWLDGREHAVADLIGDELVPLARRGLAALGVDGEDADRCLATIAARVRTRLNGAAWQRAHVAEHGRDFHALLADYLARQRSGMPVHEWGL
jgi:hypothetical protein